MAEFSASNMEDPEDDLDDYDEDEMEDDDEDDDERNSSLAKAAITGRCVTLLMLISEKIIEPGPALLSLKYLVSRSAGRFLGSLSLC